MGNRKAPLSSVIRFFCKVNKYLFSIVQIASKTWYTAENNARTEFLNKYMYYLCNKLPMEEWKCRLWTKKVRCVKKKSTG